MSVFMIVYKLGTPILVLSAALAAFRQTIGLYTLVGVAIAFVTLIALDVEFSFTFAKMVGVIMFSVLIIRRIMQSARNAIGRAHG